jgi:hypothetical protein
MNKLIILMIVSLWCVYETSAAVEGQYHGCLELVKDYYQKINYTTGPNSFYESALGHIKTFDEAMDKFRAMYTELYPKKLLANLFPRSDMLLKTIHYAYYFQDDRYFRDMKKIVSAVRAEGKYEKLSFIEANTYNPNELPLFQIGNPFLNKFCQDYDYSQSVTKMYRQLRECEKKVTSIKEKKLLKECGVSVVLNNEHLKCAHTLVDCDIEIKNFNAYWQILEIGNPNEIKNGDLLNYVKYISGDSTYIDKASGATSDFVVAHRLLVLLSVFVANLVFSFY